MVQELEFDLVNRHNFFDITLYYMCYLFLSRCLCNCRGMSNYTEILVNISALVHSCIFQEREVLKIPLQSF